MGSTRAALQQAPTGRESGVSGMEVRGRCRNGTAGALRNPWMELLSKRRRGFAVVMEESQSSGKSDAQHRKRQAAGALGAGTKKLLAREKPRVRLPLKLGRRKTQFRSGRRAGSSVEDS